jgi:hypothetical protein
MIGAEQPIRIEFADGEIAALARGGASPASPEKSGSAPRAAKPGKRAESDKQGSLF